MFINEQTFVDLGGVPQFLSIRAESENAPLLLYLHGGPGDAALPLVLAYNRALERHFTVVVWEQRGAGKSYYRFDGGITISVFLQDLQALAERLLTRFRQNALFLWGHSWGSVLGLRFLQTRPDLVRTYIGCGQVVNMKKSCREAYDFALAHAAGPARRRLEQIDCQYASDTWLRDLLFVTGQVVKHKGSLYGRTGYGALVRPFLLSRHYTPLDLIRRQRGGLQAIRCLWQELMEVDFEPQTRYGAPILLAEGRHDRHVSSALARAYYEGLETEKRFVWFEKSCHFPHWSESAAFNDLLISLVT